MRLVLLGDWGSLLNCRQNARWTEATESCFTNCSTKNAFCSEVAIIAVLRHRPKENKVVELRMRTKHEHLLFRSMWETYFWVRRNGRLKPLQSSWYALYDDIIIIIKSDCIPTCFCGCRYCRQMSVYRLLYISFVLLHTLAALGSRTHGTTTIRHTGHVTTH
jgi:hypothetical protein